MFFVFLFCQQFFLCLDTGKCFEGEEERKVLLKFQICMSVILFELKSILSALGHDLGELSK